MFKMENSVYNGNNIKFDLVFIDRKFLNNKRIVFDIYPKDSPSHPNRHYGYFDIELKDIKEKISVDLDICNHNIIFDNSQYKESWHGNYLEDGEYILYINIFDSGKRVYYQEYNFYYGNDVMNLNILQTSEKFKITKLISAVWFITWSCNFSCPYCWEVQRIKAKEFSPDPFIANERWIAAWNRLCPEILDISGGEPFMQPNFVELLQNLDSSIHIAITTNLSHDITRFVQYIDPERIFSMTISLHPTQRMSFTILSGKIRLLQERGFKELTVNYVGWPEQLYLIENYKKMVEDLGVRFHVDPYAPTPYVPYKFSIQEANYLKKYIKSDRAHWLESLNQNIPVACSGGGDHINVSPTGDAYRCILDAVDKRLYLGNILDENFVADKGWQICNFRHICPGCDRDKVHVYKIAES